MNTSPQNRMINERKSLSAKRNMKLLTTEEAAERLGVTKRRVQAMIRDGRLPAEKMGRDWFIREEDLAIVADRKPGRPPLTDEEKAQRAAQKSAISLPFEPATARPAPRPLAKPQVGAKKKASATKPAAKKAKKGGAVK